MPSNSPHQLDALGVSRRNGIYSIYTWNKYIYVDLHIYIFNVFIYLFKYIYLNMIYIYHDNYEIMTMA